MLSLILNYDQGLFTCVHVRIDFFLPDSLDWRRAQDKIPFINSVHSYLLTVWMERGCISAVVEVMTLELIAFWVHFYIVFSS